MAETAFGGCVRFAARGSASVRPAARSKSTSSLGRSFATLAKIRVFASANGRRSSPFIVHFLFARVRLIFRPSLNRGPGMSRLHFIKTFGFILVFVGGDAHGKF